MPASIDPGLLTQLNQKYYRKKPDRPDVSLFHSFNNYLLNLSYEYDLSDRWESRARYLLENKSLVMEHLYEGYQLDAPVEELESLPSPLIPRAGGAESRGDLRQFGLECTQDIFQWLDLNERQILLLSLELSRRKTDQHGTLLLSALSSEARYTAPFAQLGVETRSNPENKQPKIQIPITTFRAFDVEQFPAQDRALLDMSRQALSGVLDALKASIDPTDNDYELKHLRFAYRTIENVREALKPMSAHIAKRRELFPDPPPELIASHSRSTSLEIGDTAISDHSRAPKKRARHR